jgi:hypothetical protein
MIAFGADVTVVSLRWTAFKKLVQDKRMVMQYADDVGAYQPFAFDAEYLVYECSIWKGEVPWTVIESGYTQELNDADLADFKGNYQANCNWSVAPKGSDGTPATLPCLFPNGVYLYLSGAGDGASARGVGDPFVLSSDTAEDKTFEWGYLDWVLIAGGGMSHQGGQAGDYCTMEVVAPATAVVPNAGGTGNCNLVDPGVGAAILIVPAAGNGAYDVDLAAAVPVPAWDAMTGACSGFFEWDKPSTGKGTISVGAPQQSHFNLFAIELTLMRFCNRMPLLGSGVLDFNIPAVEPKTIMPHWKGRVTLHNVGHAGLVGAWYLTTARMKTV